MSIKDLLNRQNNNLDLVRILLASAVIFGHTSYLNGNDSPYWIDPIRYFFKFTYSGALAVKVFFFISGLVVTNSLIANPKIIPFITARFFRIFPGLLFVVTLSALVLCPFLTTLPLKYYILNIEVYKYVISNCLLIIRIILPGVFENNFYPYTVNGSLWSLKYEFCCYFFLATSFFIGKKKIVYNIIILVIIFDALVYPHFFKLVLDHSSDSHLLPFCFAIGSLLAINKERFIVSKFVSVAFLALLILFIDTAYAEVLLVLFFCNTILILSVNKFFLKFRPKYDISYGIYLWGFFIQQSVFAIFGYIHSALHFFISLIVSICMALISYKFVEYPFMRIGKNLLAKIEKSKFLNK